MDTHGCLNRTSWKTASAQLAKMMNKLNQIKEMIIAKSDDDLLTDPTGAQGPYSPDKPDFKAISLSTSPPIKNKTSDKRKKITVFDNLLNIGTQPESNKIHKIKSNSGQSIKSFHIFQILLIQCFFVHLCSRCQSWPLPRPPPSTWRPPRPPPWSRRRRSRRRRGRCRSRWCHRHRHRRWGVA